MCAESNIYGVALCVESELRREYYHEEYPLYYFLGYTHMALKIVPGKQHYTHTVTVPVTHFHMASSMYQIFSSSGTQLLNLHKTVSFESCDLMLNLQTCCQ